MKRRATDHFVAIAAVQRWSRRHRRNGRYDDLMIGTAAFTYRIQSPRGVALGETPCKWAAMRATWWWPASSARKSAGEGNP